MPKAIDEAIQNIVYGSYKTMSKFFRQNAGNDTLEDLDQTTTDHFVMMQALRSYLVVIFSIGVALGAGLSHGMNSVSTYTSFSSQNSEVLYVTLAEYEQVALRMSLARVEAILGKGIEVSQSESMVILEWRNIDDSSMTLFFEQGYLVQKEQAGLM